MFVYYVFELLFEIFVGWWFGLIVTCVLVVYVGVSIGYPLWLVYCCALLVLGGLDFVVFGRDCVWIKLC